MGNRKKYLYAIALLAVLCIGFVIGVLVDWPKGPESELAGTVGKASKYRNVKMSEKDIELRSELTRDTAQLKAMIQGMITFSIASEEVCKNIQMAVASYRFKGMGNQAGEDDQLRILEDYAGYIQNNNGKLTATIRMLTGFMQKDPADQSQDVERNLREFGTYIKGLLEKNRLISEASTAMDRFMLNQPAMTAHQEGLKELKSVRDRLLISGIKMAAIIGDRQQVGLIVQSALSNEEKIAVLLGQEKLGVVAAINVVASSVNSLSITVGAFSANTLGAAENMVAYDPSKLQFCAFDQSGIKAIAREISGSLQSESRNAIAGSYSAIAAMERILLFGTGGFNVVIQANTLGKIIGSNIGIVVNAQDLNIVFSTGSINSMVPIGNFGAIVNIVIDRSIGNILL